MNLYHGHTGQRLQDRNGHVSYAFIHEGGARLELRVKPQAASELENKRVVVKGKFLAPGTVLAAEVQIDVSSPIVSSPSWTKKLSGIIALAIPWWRT